MGQRTGVGTSCVGSVGSVHGLIGDVATATPPRQTSAQALRVFISTHDVVIDGSSPNS